MKTVVGLFDSTNDAQRMLEDLMQMGFEPNDISVVTNMASQQNVEAGAIHLDSMSLVDVGKIAASGPLRETLRRSSGSDLALRGALQRSGFPPDVAERYATGVERGGTLESLVVPDSEADRVVAAMKRRSAAEERKAADRQEPVRQDQEARQDLRQEKTRREEREGVGAAGIGGAALAAAAGVRGGVAREAREKEAATEATGGYVKKESAKEPLRESLGSRGLEADEEWRIPVLREELKVGKRSTERGGVRVSVRVMNKPVTEQVRLRETHVEIERHPVDRAVAAEMDGFRDQTIEVPERGEETVISKQARVVEEVIVHKHVTDRVETVEESLRATQVDFNRIGAESARFRDHFARLGTSGEFDEYEPAYRMGQELSGTGKWEDIESSARSRWEAKRPGTWDRFKEAIRFGHRGETRDTLDD